MRINMWGNLDIQFTINNKKVGKQDIKLLFNILFPHPLIDDQNLYVLLLTTWALDIDVHGYLKSPVLYSMRSVGDVVIHLSIVSPTPPPV